jgi:hypothetical protein
MWLLESMKNQPRTMNLTETNHSSGHQVDREAGVIRNVKILGRTSGNGRVYSDKAIADAVGFYEGIDVNIDHPSRSKPNAERSMADWAGVLEGVKERPDGVYGDLKLLQKHALAPQIMEAAERMAGNFGLSHNAQGKVTGPKGKQVVESLGSVRSVDIVRSPATVAGLFESIEIEDENMKKTIFEAIKEEFPDTAAGAIELLEQDGVAGVVPPEAEAPAGGALDGVKQSLADEAVKIFLDPNIDARETGKQVGELAKVAEQVAAKLEGKKPEAPKEEPKEDEPMIPESLDTKRLGELTHKAEVRDVLEEAGLRKADLSDRQAKLLESAVDRDAMDSLMESWPELADTATMRQSVRSQGPRNTTLTEEKSPEDAESFAKRLHR